MQIPGLQTGQQEAQPQAGGTVKIARAAADFEALLIAHMLRSAREAAVSDAGEGGDGAETNSAVMELGEQQFAQALANSGGLGVAKMVIAGLSNDAHR